ncbi:pyruvate formate-lyase-activating protein [Enterovirga sp.]|uniref:pyruvate formate-lyase-activating protein n=1 Tax=Enterovirga sp. TaxID=2026350 RepID=UPI002BCB19DB|nr:pyruvate formate-lyase-activating protein [Enterovirga sp.]HMO28673.1 pyruvate formate-lyase-activating protein [Enterovirga sp.]
MRIPEDGRYALHLSQAGVHARAAAHSYSEAYPSDEETREDEESLLGYVHSIEVGSTVDGPGIRFVLFLTGCPLRCQYCHNPDTWHKSNGRPIKLNQMMSKIGKYVKVLRISQGGLTISGGEPVLQHGFATRVFRRAKELGLHTCLDTCGRLGERLTDEELLDIDLNLLDIKSGDPETYQRVTGQPLEPTLQYARRLSDLGRKMWIRYVLVPGLTDAYDNIEKVADIAASLRTVERVEILRFHQMGMEKYHKLKIPYPLENTEPPTPELTERVRGQFRSRGLTVF